MKQNFMQTNAIKQDPLFKMCLQSTLRATDADHFTKNISVKKKKGGWYHRGRRGALLLVGQRLKYKGLASAYNLCRKSGAQDHFW